MEVPVLYQTTYRDQAANNKKLEALLEKCYNDRDAIAEIKNGLQKDK